MSDVREVKIPCTVYSAKSGVPDVAWQNWRGLSTDDVDVIHLDRGSTLPSGLHEYRGNDDQGVDWNVTNGQDDKLPSWIHTHPPAKTDPSCSSCKVPV